MVATISVPAGTLMSGAGTDKGCPTSPNASTRRAGPAWPSGRHTPSPALSGTVLVSALTGYGLDTLRAEIAAVLSSLWVDVDFQVPYAAGELLARVRERGTVELEYGERDVRVHGRAAPGLAGELDAVSAEWARTIASSNGRNGSDPS